MFTSGVFQHHHLLATRAAQRLTGEVMGAVLWTLEGTILKALDLDAFCSALAQHCMLT